MATTMHVVSHTHWDREWYQPFEVFRLRLVDLLDHLLEILDTDPDFVHFSLDAQTIVLEDYLQIRPGERERLTKHIRAGRIAIGPWYQLNDEFLVSGEATVRSLLIGHRIARQFGEPMKVGYLPDQFGNISQMPQILRGFGIDNALMGRGRQLEPGDTMEFWWEAPDGSRVLASLMAYWYNNAQYIPDEPEEAFAYISRLRDTMREKAATDHLLFMNGVDHLEAQPGIGRTIRATQELLAENGCPDRLLHSSLTGYMDGLRRSVEVGRSDLATVKGELRQDRGGACLAGTLSTRTYLKQANDAAQVQLERYAEPLSVFARLNGGTYPADELRYAWKLLMENHPHDSICGCSVDQVHDEMERRFDRVLQVTGVLKDRALDALTGRDRRAGAIPLPCDLHVVNTLNWSRTDPVKVTLEFPLGPPSRGNPQRDDGRRVRALRIVGPDGAEAPYGVTADETLIATVSNPRELPLDQWVQRLSIEFVAANVPPCGVAVYRLLPADAPAARQTSMERCVDVGTYSYDEPVLEDVGDVGDEYLFRSPMNGLRVEHCLACADGWSAQITPVRRTNTTIAELHVPRASVAAARSEETCCLPIRLERTTWAGVDRVEMSLTVENRATDHRLRALFDTAGQAVAAAPFDVVSRNMSEADIASGAAPFHPMTLWVDTPGDEEMPGRTVIAPGIHEYEMRKGANGEPMRVGITLLRCVGQLSGRGDGPGIATPGAQCVGKHTFRIAVHEHHGDWQEAKVWKQAHQFECPLAAVQAPLDEKRERSTSYVRLDPDWLIVTAIKVCEDRDSAIVRFYNPTEAPVDGAGLSVPGSRQWRLVNLNEEPIDGWHEGTEATVQSAAKQIVTVEFGL